MIARSKFLSDFAVAAILAMGISAMVGASSKLDPVTTRVPWLLGGAALTAWLLALRGAGTNARISSSITDGGEVGTLVARLAATLPLLLLVTLALWGPFLDGLLGVAGPAIGAALAAAAGGLIAGLAHRFPPWRPGAASVAIAGVLLPVGVVVGLPAMGTVGLAILGAVGLLAAGWLVPAPSAEATGSRAAGVAAGLGLTGLLTLHLVAVPWLSSDPALVGWLAAGVLLGAGLGHGERLPVLAAAGLPALGLALGAELVPLAPDAIDNLLGSAESRAMGAYQLPGLGLGAIGAMIGGGVGRLTRDARAADIGLGVALGLSLHALLPRLLGADGALHAMAVAAAVAVFPLALAASSASARLGALGLPALAAAAVLLAPPDDSMLPFAPWADYAQQTDLAATRRAAERTDTVGDGRVTLAVREDQVVAAQHGGQRTGWSERDLQADRFFGHLGLLLVDQPSAILVAGLGTGQAVDALRRATPARIDLVEPDTAWLSALRKHVPVVRGSLADPAVRRVPRASGPYDLVLVDVPAPWTFGADAVLSPRRVRSLRSSLSPGGVAVFRITLGDVSADDLARHAQRIGGAFQTVVAWLDPQAADHLLLTAWPERRRVPVQTMRTGWTRANVADDLRTAGLPELVDVLERALTDRDGLVLLAEHTSGRDAAGAAIVGGARVRRGKASVALASLATAGRGPELLFDLDEVPPDIAEELRDRLEAGAQTRSTYLQLLGHIARGQSKEAIALALQLSNASANPARDLRSLIAPWLRRGQTQLQEGRWEDARTEFTTALQFSPKDRDVNLGLARALIRLGEHEEAANHAQKLLDEDAADAEATLVLADIRVQQGRMADAVRLLEAAEPLHPGNETLLTNLGFLLTQLAQGSDVTIERRLSRARVLFQRAAALAPTLPQPRAGLAEVYYRLGELDLALREIDRALSIDESCHYRTIRGHVLAARSELPQAEAELQKALLACPEAVDALVMLGAVLADQRKLTEARQSWERALAIDPGNAAARGNLQQLDESGLEEILEKTQP